MKAKRCEFCGSAKHLLAGCTLPGVVSYRQEKETARDRVFEAMPEAARHAWLHGTASCTVVLP